MKTLLLMIISAPFFIIAVVLIFLTDLFLTTASIMRYMSIKKWISVHNDFWKALDSIEESDLN